MRNLLFAEQLPLEPASRDEVIEALEQARQTLASGRRLAKGHAIDLVDGWPCWCIVAAITRASRTTQIRDAALTATRHALPGRFGRVSVEVFNDHPSTTLDDAKTVLYHAKSFVGTVAAA